MHEQVRPTDANDGVKFLFTADRYFILGDEQVTADLGVNTDDGQPVAVTITQAFAAVPPDGARTPLAFTPQGLVQGATFAPKVLGVERQSAVGLYVEFTYNGGKTQRANLMIQYTPAAGIPATFTGSFHDAIEGGSLAIHAGVSVTRAGHYVIDANLFDAQDKPVAWTRWKGDLVEGTQDAPLVFFGKVIRDADARGPYHLGQLRGARFDPTRDPDLEQMPSYTGAFSTAAYEPTQFSGDEYDSDQKRRMIDFLTQQQAAGMHQGAARGGNDPGGPTEDK
ncbi:MAG TPA: hypothetical protein VGM88_11060 [Kofleriaceae bacterium]|jgi:hypothetical protein